MMAERKAKIMKVESSAVHPLEAKGTYSLSQAPGKSMSVRTLRAEKRASIKEIPLELMRMIFAMSDKRVCAAAALVCRHWCNIALDELWRSLPSLLPLFKVLGPLLREEYGQDLHPDLAITAQSWDLFKSYATRVRCLTYEDDDMDMAISTELIMRALVAHPHRGILPNLQAVVWRIYTDGLNHALAFCPPSLERMSLDIAEEYISVNSAKKLLYSLSLSLANQLKFFRFETNFQPSGDAALTAALNTFLQNQSGLLELKFPRYEIQDPAIISEACQASPHLRTFCGEVLGFTKEMLRAGLNALGRRGDSLRSVWLSRSGTGFQEETVFLADIEPLLQLSIVEDIRIWFGCKLELEARDIQLMGGAWKGLTSLILYHSEGHGIPLAHFVTFSQWFPALQQFAARFDCSGYIPTADKVSSRFKSLRRLTFLDDGSIPDDGILWIAEFLAVVCAPGINVQFAEYDIESDMILNDEDLFEDRWFCSGNKELRDRMDAFYRMQESMKRMG